MMSLLRLLLAFGLLSACGVATAQRAFTIRAVTLSVEPGPEVTRGTNVTLRCQAVVSTSGSEALVREFRVYKDGEKVYSKTSSSPEDFLYPLPDARVSNSGKYKCEVHVEGKHLASESRKLTVMGLSKPSLHLLNNNRGVVTEGEEVTARCSAPGETGSIFFYFYDGAKEIHEERVSANQADAKLRFSGSGVHRIHCDYTVLITPDSVKSEDSNTAMLSVQELSISPLLEVSPPHGVVEGDRLTITCAVRNFPQAVHDAQLYLSQGTRLLSSSGSSRLNHSMLARADGPAIAFECRLDMGHVVKAATKTVPVTELFSVPTLTLSPAAVFQRDAMTLTCRSETVAAERLDRKELTYAVYPQENTLVPTDTAGVFSGRALLYDFNYTCAAQARGIVKHSQTLAVRPKVSVSVPKISVYGGKAVLGQPIHILCQSDVGSLPINYTLLWGFEEVKRASVQQPLQQAVFTVSISKPEELSKYMCEARNGDNRAPLSKRLNATVVEPLTQPTLTVIPDLSDISEGDRLYLICGVKGTPPVTFKWFRVGERAPLNNSTTDKNHKDFQVASLSREHAGTYYCEAVNHANNVVQSERVHIEVRMALWKKALLGGVSLLVASVLLVVACVLYFRSKRGRREAPAELSVKPSSPKSDEPLTVTLAHAGEVYNADAAPLFDGKEGRETNGTGASVASLPAYVSNRSSYSNPATV